MHLLYTRFRSVTPQLAPLLNELERRATAHPEELSALLSECHTAYFSARKTLLVGRLMEEIRGLDPTHTELVELVKMPFPYKNIVVDFYLLDKRRMRLFETTLYGRVQSLPRVFRFWWGSTIVSRIVYCSYRLEFSRHL